MSKTTFFKVDRDIQNHWLWSDKPFSKGQAWIDLLLLASFKDRRDIFRGSIIDKKRGEVHASIGFLADRWGWSRNKVYRFLELLNQNDMVTTNGTTNGTIIYIEKYAFYQGEYKANGTIDGTVNGTTDGTANGTTDGTQTIKNNKDNKDNNVYLFKVPKNDDDILENSVLCDDAKNKWIDIRNKVRGSK